MKRKLYPFVVIMVIICLVLSGCGAPYSNQASDTGIEAAVDSKNMNTTSESADTSNVEQNGKRIITYQIDYRIDDIIEGNRTVKERITHYKGYVDTEEIFSNRQTYNYTLRIPQESVDAFVDDLNEKFGNPTHLNKQTENVTGTYTDLEMRIKTEDAKLTRLNALMAQATDMKDMITLEEAIAESISRKESMQNELNRLDHSVRYATLYVSLSSNAVTSAPLRDSFGTRVAKAFQNMLTNSLLFVENTVILLIHLLPLIIILALVILYIRKRHKKDLSLPKNGLFKWAKSHKNKDDQQD